MLLYSPRIDITSVLRCLHEVRFYAERVGAHSFPFGGISRINGEGVVCVLTPGDEYHGKDRDNGEEVW